MFHRRVHAGRVGLLSALGVCGFGLVLPACGPGNGPDAPGDSTTGIDPAAVNSRAAGGLALGAADASRILVAAAAGTPAGDIDLFTGSLAGVGLEGDDHVADEGGRALAQLGQLGGQREVDHAPASFPQPAGDARRWRLSRSAGQPVSPTGGWHASQA